MQIFPEKYKSIRRDPADRSDRRTLFRPEQLFSGNRDYIFMVDDISKMFITGPQVVKTVVNEECTVEELGGAKVHATKSGVTHFTYQDETSCFEGVKQLLSYLPGSYLEKPPVKELADETNGKKSRCSTEYTGQR